jgi:hypothetical protein
MFVRFKTLLKRGWSAIEPWYDWGEFGLVSIRNEVAGDGRFFNIDFLGLHLLIVVGLTPKVSA